MLFTSLLRRLTRGPQLAHETAPGRRAAETRRFVPRLTALEDRSLPSASPGPLPFKETLTFLSASSTGQLYYEGNGTHFGHVTAVVDASNPSDATDGFVKTAANGDTVAGYVTHTTATTGAITFTGGIGRFQGATGDSTYVISTNPRTGAITIDVTGTISYGQHGQVPGPAAAEAAKNADSQAVPFKVTGSGIGAHGIPTTPNTPAPHDATGTATHLGKYTGEGMFQLLTFTSRTTGTFNSATPFVFVAANGDRLAFNYAGTFELIPTGDGKFIVVFTAEFTPVAELSTGRFANVTGGSFIMVATTEPFVLGSTDPVAYSWVGEGTIEFAKGKK